MTYTPSIVTPIMLASGIDYPAPVAKAYKAQQTAEAAHIEAVTNMYAAQAAIETAEATDRTALTEAASKGSGAPTASKADAARRQYAYAEEVAVQAQAQYIDAASKAQETVKAHATEILPLAIQAAKAADLAYTEATETAKRVIADANAVMQNAALGLNQLRRHIDWISFQVNWVPANITVTDVNSLGNLNQIVKRLEFGMTEQAPVKAERPAPDARPAEFYLHPETVLS